MTCWVENQLVAKKAQSIWPKIVAVVDFCSTLLKSKQPGRGDPNKSYQVLLSKCKDQLITVKFQFFEEIAAKMNIFLKRFQTDAPMVSFLVDTLDQLIRYMCSKFVLNVLEKAKMTASFIKLSMLDRNIQKVTTEVSFGLKSHLKDLKKENKVKESEVHLFLQELKQFLATCNHLLTKSPINSHFARYCRCLNPVYIAE